MGGPYLENNSNKNTKTSSFKSNKNIQKKDSGPDRSVSDKQSSSVTLNELAMKARKNNYNFEFQQRSCTRQNMKHMCLVLRKPVFGVFGVFRSDTNQAVQLQKMVRGLNFRIYEVEGLYYPCSENKGADQQSGYREADLCLCFRTCKKPVFS